MFAGHALREVLPELKRWFGTDAQVNDTALLERTVTMDVPLDSPRQAIEAVEQSAGLKAVFEGKKMFFEDAAVAAARVAAPKKLPRK